MSKKISNELIALILNEAGLHEVVEGSSEFNNKLDDIKNKLISKGSLITVINNMLVEITMEKDSKISVKLVE